MVSNSLASCANSSSGSGSSRSLTDLTVTVTSASWPACSPATSVVVNTLRLVGLETLDRVVETLDQLTRADLVRQALGLGLGDVLAVDGGRQVDRDEVAVLGGAVDAGERAEAGAQVLQLGVDLVVGDLDGVDGEGQRRQVGQRDLGADVDLGGERQVPAVLLAGDLDLGLPEGLHLGAGDGLAVAGRDGLADDLVEHRLLVDARLEQLHGHLARAEPGHPDRAWPSP